VFEPLLYTLRGQGVGVGLGEWITFLRGLEMGLASDVDALYHYGRSILVHTEANYDAWDQAFTAFTEGLELQPILRVELERWLSDPLAYDPAKGIGNRSFEDLESLMQAFRDILEKQNKDHRGGSRWVGTGGTSPWGSGGRAEQGIALGSEGGNRTGIRLADARRWRDYRRDKTLGVRDFKVALRDLRHLVREGAEVLDIDETISESAKNAGEIELVFNREKANRVRLVLMLDSGGSMAPHADVVDRLFTAAHEINKSRAFKSFEVWQFHNCVYRWLYRDYDQWERVTTSDVLKDLTPKHRLVFVGDASMAPWELFARHSAGAISGHDQLKRFADRCPASIWINPDPKKWWSHPTVDAIGKLFRMYPLTLDGLRDAVRYLRAPI
jgi:uncharacterized protein with von Willebrand factor type A (vWA) domain